MGEKFKIVIVGCGKISKNHFKAISNLENAELYGVCDIDKEKADRAGKDHGNVKVFYDYQDVLDDSNVDSVHLCLPHNIHAQMAVRGLKAGKNVLSEKPVALASKDAEEIIEVQKTTGKAYGVCFQNRYNGASKAIKEIIDSGKLGKIIGGRGSVIWNRGANYYEGSPWKGTWSGEGGGVLINQAIHTFDLLNWFTGEKMVSVNATASQRRLTSPIEVEDTMDVIMENKDGARFLFYATNCYVANDPVEIEIVCENGSIHMIKDKVIVTQGQETQTYDYTSGIVYGLDYWGSGHGYLIEDFYNSLAEKKAFPVDATATLSTSRLVEAIYNSIRTSKVIHLKC